MNERQKQQLDDLVKYTIWPAIYEDLDISFEDEEMVEEACNYLINALGGKA